MLFYLKSASFRDSVSGEVCFKKALNIERRPRGKEGCKKKLDDFNLGQIKGPEIFKRLKFKVPEIFSVEYKIFK